MRRGSATDNGRGDEPDAGIGMHHGVERARRIELPYAAWEAAVLPLNYARGSLFALSMIFSENRQPLFRIMLP